MHDVSPVYHPRDPQASQYYQCVEDHFERLEQVYDDRFAKQYEFFRPYVRQVIYRFLDCGILHNGFAHVRCGDCGHEYLLTFSFKRLHPRFHGGKHAPAQAGVRNDKQQYLC